MMRTLLFTLLVFFATPALAQTFSSAAPQTELTFEPFFPKPGQEVTVSFNNFGRFSGSDIIWTLNDEEVADVRNRSEMTFIAGPLGSPDIVTATVVRSSGAVQNFQVEVVPTYVDIIIEPQTRVPDFYVGRGAPSVGSRINVTALVNNGELLEGDYLYTWRLNGQVLEGGPIRGTNQVSFDNPRGSRSTIIVGITTVDGQSVGRRSIYYRSLKPELVFYENNALYGQSHNAISRSLLMVGQAATVVAEPYHLDIRTYNNPDITEWEIDGQSQVIGGNPYQITIQKVAEDSSSNLTFHVRSTSELLQGAKDDFKIVY